MKTLLQKLESEVENKEVKNQFTTKDLKKWIEYYKIINDKKIFLIQNHILRVFYHLQL